MIRAKDQSPAILSYSLQILINLTFESANVSLSLTSKESFYQLLMSTLIRRDDFCQDAVWLLVHLANDACLNLSTLLSENLFGILREKLEARVLQAEDVCQVSSLILGNLTAEVIQESLASSSLGDSQI
jgi:hypothetical protein